MEFLNNIWMAISTPNEALINIMAVPFIFVENTLIMYLAIYLLNIKTTKKQKILFVSLLSIVAVCTLHLLPEPYNSLVNYMVAMLLFHFVLKTNILKSILAVIFPTIIFVLVGTIALNPLSKILHMDLNAAESIPIYRLSYVTFSDLILLMVILFIKNKNIYFNILEELDKKTKIILVSSLLLGLFVLETQIFISAYYTNNLPIFISFLSFLVLLSYIVISLYTITRIMKLTNTTKQLQNAEEYNKTLQILHDNIREFRHDYNNKIATLGGYIKTNDIEGLKTYYEELEKECLKVNQLHMLNPNIINNPGIYSLLTTKYSFAEEKDIDFNINVMLDLNTINMKMFDFTKILGILLDNSIDAAKECDKKIINITFKDDEANNRQLLIIENTYNNKDVDIDKIFDKGETSKRDHTGLGLWEIRKILKRNNNLNLHTTKDKKYFTQQFEIYK